VDIRALELSKGDYLAGVGQLVFFLKFSRLLPHGHFLSVEAPQYIIVDSHISSCIICLYIQIDHFSDGGRIAVPLVVERIEDRRVFDVSAVGEETRRDDHWGRISGLILLLSFFRKRGRVGDAEFMSFVEGFSFWDPSFEGGFEHMHNNYS